MDLIDNELDIAHFYGATHPGMFEPFRFTVVVDYMNFNESVSLKILWWAAKRNYVIFMGKTFTRFTDIVQVTYKFLLTEKGFDLYKIRLL